MRISEAVHASEIDGFIAKPFQIDAVVAAALRKDNGKCRP